MADFVGFERSDSLMKCSVVRQMGRERVTTPF